MKIILALLSVLAPLTLLAKDEIRIHGETWDSLTIPLKIVPIYLEIEDAAPARSAQIEMEVYVKGKLKRTISTGAMNKDEQEKSSSVKAAIYFRPVEGGKVDGTMVLAWRGMRVASPFTSTEEEIPMHGGQASGAFSGKLVVPGRSPIFYAVFGGKGGFAGAGDPQEVVRLNPESTVIIGYLKTE